MKLYESPFQGLNDIIIGVPSRTPVGIMGPAAEGKTILVEEWAFKIASEIGKDVLVINTEKPNSQIYELWELKLQNKYGKDTKIYVEEALSIEDLMKLNGFKIEIRLSQSSEDKKAKKVPILMGVDIEKSPVRKYITEKNVGVVVYDSLTTPFNTVLIGGQQNTPARYEVEEMFFQSIRLLFKGTECAVFTINHVSFNPQKPFLSREDIQLKGGKSILHSHEYVFYVEQARSKYLLNKRTLWIVRHPILREWKHRVELWLDDNGWRELTEEEIAKLKAETKAELKGEDKPETKGDEQSG